MTRSFCIGAVALASILFVQSAAAEEYDAVRKLGRGFSNLTLGVFEIPRSIVDENRANGALSAATVGLAQGLANAPTRMVLGIYEIFSAPFGLPSEYVPMMEPEYVWELANAASTAPVAATPDQFLDAEAEQIGRIPGAIVARRDGALIVLFPSDLLFSAGSWDLAESARSRIAELSLILEQNPDAQVQVVGHADASGAEALNGTLSAARAESVRAAMVARGIDGERIEAVGRGESDPIASNETEGGRAQNRRVEIEIRASAVAAR